MSLFGRLLGAAVQGAGARRAGLNAGEALRVEREKTAAEAARQQRMDVLRMALDRSTIEDRRADNERQRQQFDQTQQRLQAFHTDSERHADAREARTSAALGRGAAASQRAATAAERAALTADRAEARRQAEAEMRVRVRQVGGANIRPEDYARISARHGRLISQAELIEIAGDEYRKTQRANATNPADGDDPYRPKPQ